MTAQVFTETIDLSEAQLDASNRVLRGVVLIRAGESANKRLYPPEVLQASVEVFQGVKAYADHPTREALKARPERSIRDITGWYENVRFEDNRLVADRRFTTTQAGNDAYAIAEMVASGAAPKTLAGLSINAVGRAKPRDDGGVVVESITFAQSVDDVTTPAAGGSYIESAGGDLTSALVEAMGYEEWLTARSDYRDRFEQEHRKIRRDAKLREAREEIGRLSEYAERCAILETENAQLQEQLAAAVATAALSERKVRIAELLAGAKLPADWKAELKDKLLETDPDQWGTVVEQAILRAKSAGYKPSVPVDVPAPREAPKVQIRVQESAAPRPDEDAVAYGRRLRKMKEES